MGDSSCLAMVFTLPASLHQYYNFNSNASQLNPVAGKVRQYWFFSQITLSISVNVDLKKRVRKTLKNSAKCSVNVGVNRC